MNVFAGRQHPSLDRVTEGSAWDDDGDDGDEDDDGDDEDDYNDSDNAIR